MARSLMDLLNRLRESLSNSVYALSALAIRTGKRFKVILLATAVISGKAFLPLLGAMCLLMILFTISFLPAVVLLRAVNVLPETSSYWLGNVIETLSDFVTEKFSNLYQKIGNFGTFLSVISSLSLLGYIFTNGLNHLKTQAGVFATIFKEVVLEIWLIYHPVMTRKNLGIQQNITHSKIKDILFNIARTSALLCLIILALISSVIATKWSLSSGTRGAGIETILVEYSPSEQMTIPVVYWQMQGQLDSLDGICLTSGQIERLKEFESWLLKFASTYSLEFEIEVRGYASVAPVSSTSGHSGSDAFNRDIANRRAATVIAFFLDNNEDREEWPCRCYNERFDQSWIKEKMDSSWYRDRQYYRHIGRFGVIYRPWDSYDEMIRLRPGDDGSIFSRRVDNEYRNRSVEFIVRITAATRSKD